MLMYTYVYRVDTSILLPKIDCLIATQLCSGREPCVLWAATQPAPEASILHARVSVFPRTFKGRIWEISVEDRAPVCLV